MALHLTTSQIERMISEAQTAAPDECCGILVGRREGERVVVKALAPAANVWEGDRQTRFMLEPHTQLRVQRACRDIGLEIVGFYHSHPHSPPVPSRFDLEMAWPDHSYVIVTLLDEEPAVRSWRFNEMDRQFVEDALLIDHA